MASTNQSPEFLQAQKEYLLAQTDEERLLCLQEMLKYVPKHKAGEAMRANLRTRYKKLREKISKSKIRHKKQGIKKSEAQALLIGMPNSGKSSIFKVLTNQETKISANPFSTTEPKLGTLNYEDVKIQIIDMPPSPNPSLINTADTLLIVIDNISQIQEIQQFIKNSKAEQIYIFNKSDLLDENQKRKTLANLKSKRLNAMLFSTKTQENLEELKKKIFESFPIIRIYTKEPRKSPSKEPMLLKSGSSVKDVAEKILKGLSAKIKQAKITGPSSKFPNQIVGMNHILKDKDIVELRT